MYNESLTFRYIDTSTLQKVCNQYEKGNFVKMEARLTRYDFVNCTLVPMVPTKFSNFGGNWWRHADSHYTLSPELDKRIRRHSNK